MTLNDFIKAFRELDPVLQGACFYCGVQTRKQDALPHHAIYQTRDHVIPVSVKHWDRFVESRCVRCCRKCNSIKEDLTLQEFKMVSETDEFFCEKLLGIRIEALEDIEEITKHIQTHRRIEGRSIKFKGKPLPRLAVSA
jgi:hypothetical protein